ncbi:unnamed protein product [Spodoptera littoralis]|uniref:Spaetzle domain-containing protein n=1 Tax=Spodoptera littoralis TaxID=7109 RepID=A0A9P0I001_SPOLI|nr:unnamed protein product [Spodoptera littoralis]CAB3517046.1 unnamed protein product [Spodoptera littoralis]CAH1637304.1 unnamed protein product [Spodoptera littoralis]CAH1646953.1 unnamed protein product [Spodoptera littoralis]
MCRFSVSAYLIAVLLSFSKSNGNPVFDGSIITADGNPLDKLEMPAACKDQTFCFEKGDNYPEQKVEKFLQTFPLQKHLGSRIGFSFRDGDKENGNADCPANTTYVDQPIYYVFDESGIVRPVIQSPEKFEQLYSTRWCLNEGYITQNTRHFFPESKRLKKFQIECVTTLMDLDFIVLVEEFEELTYKVVKAMGGIPVCCKCQYHTKKMLQ